MHKEVWWWKPRQPRVGLVERGVGRTGVHRLGQRVQLRT